MSIEEILLAEQNGEYLAKNWYYQDILGAIEQDVILAFESAAEFLGLTTGNFLTDVHVYSACDLPAPFVVHPVASLEGIEFVELNGCNVASVNQTANDLLSSNDVDLQILLEFLGMYYYKHEESFEGLEIGERNRERFDEVREWAIAYWDE